MADNESKVSVEAEISVDTSKANSGLDKTGKTLDSLLKGVGSLSSEMDGLVKKFVELQKVAGKALSSMSKDEISKATGLLAKAEQIRGRGNSGGTGKSSKKRSGGHSKKNNSSNAQANKIAKSTDDVGDSVSDMTELAGDIAKSFESMGDSIQSLAGTVKSLEKKVSSTDIRAKEAEAKSLNASSRAKSVEIRDKELEIKGLNASTRKKKVEQEAPLVEEKVKTEATKQILNKARAGRINEDHRYKAGWYGGIASGVGGAISRSRARSGFAGFMARVGTGVGQKHPGMNIMKGATLSGLGLNPLTLAFSAVGAGIAKLVEGLGQLSVESLQAYGEVEKLKTGLSVVFGSDTEANTMFEGIKDYSLESPFGVEQTTEMATLLKQSGVYGTELLDTMRMIGDTAGGNEEKFKRIANNYAQIASIGKASMLDMRQFAYAGIPIYKKVAEELGVSQSVLRQMISDGEVTAEVIEKVFKTMTSEGGEFYKSVERGAQTLNARLVNLQDAMSMAKAGFGENMFKADIFTIGNDGNNEGTLGQLLGWVEDLARKADSWAELQNISRDVASISKRERIVSDLEKLIARNELKGMDTSALESMRSRYLGMDNPESVRASRVRLYDVTKSEYDKLNNANLEELNKRLNSLMSIDTKGIDKDLVKEIEKAVHDLEEEIQAVEDFRRGYDKYEMEDILSQNDIYKAEADATALATRVFESARKNALSATSLNTKAEESRQEYYNSEQGKAELWQKKVSQRTKDQEEFNRFRRIISDTGMMLDSLSVSASNFVELMKSGIIVPEDVQTVTRDALLVDDDDTDKEKAAKAQAWDDMASRALQVKQYEAELPRELQFALGQVISSVTSIPNTEAGFKLLSKSLQELSEMQAFNNSDLAQQMVGYILTSSASVSDKIYDVAHNGRGGGKDDSYPPLWKRITGAATGVDPNFITNARDFYKLYGSQFEGRNISQGVISGMTASGRDMKDIIRLLKYTGKKSTHKGSEGAPLIDWERTGQSFSDFALSMDASVVEMKALQSALYSQIDVYDKMKETMLTTGEDWDKLSPDKLEEQLWNAFGGIDGGKMIATNSMGEQREIEFNEANELVFKGTDRLFSSQDEFRLNLENTVTALDSLRAAAMEAALGMSMDILNREQLADSAGGMAKSILGQVSAQSYLDKKSSSPDAVKEVLGDTVDLLLREQRESPADYERRFSEDTMKAVNADVVSAYTAFTGHTPSAMGFEDELAQAVQRAIGVLDRTDFSSMADAVAAGDQSAIFLKSVNSLASAKLAEGMSYDEAGNLKGSFEELSRWTKLLFDSNKDLVDAEAALERQLRIEAGRNRTANVLKNQKFNRDISEETTNTINEVVSGAGMSRVPLSLKSLEIEFRQMALELGDMNLTFEEFLKIRRNEAEEEKENIHPLDIAGMAAWNKGEGVRLYQEGKATGDSAEAAKGLGLQALGGAQEIAANALQGTNIGAAIEGFQNGGVWGAIIGAVIDALGKIIGNLDILMYALEPVTNLLSGLAPILKVLILPMVVVSHVLEIFGDALEKGISTMLSWFGIDVEEIDKYYEYLLESNEEREREVELLRQLNDQLDNTRKAFIEAEEYYLKEKTHQNATWAIEAQGLYGGGAVTNVNDMILTPHGTFSTAPDDYILAMKDPTSLMGDRGVGSGYVQVKFVVNNNASDLVDAQASEQTGDDGTKELIVTISRAIAGDYASGRNGWDSAISGRRVREQGRRVTR